MRKILFFTWLILGSIAISLNAQDPDQYDFILNMTEQVDADSLSATILDLESFVSRYSTNPNRIDVANYIANRFRGYGYEVMLDTFIYVNNRIDYEQYNVIAKLIGTSEDSPILIGAHHDSCCRNDSSPGADDNASGVSAVMEAARIFSQSGLQPHRTVYFCTWAAEEQGLLGSKHFATNMYDQGIDFGLAINLDMIANNNNDFNAVNVQTSPDIKEQAFLFSELIDSITFINAMSTGNSDHASFRQKGYPILYFHEYDFSPVYHSPKDLHQYLNMEYCSLVVQATLANLVAFSSMLEAPLVNIAGNSGTGNGVYVEWESVDGALGYHMRLKSGQETVFDTSVVNVNSLLVENIDYQQVVMTISAIDSNDFEGQQFRKVINLNLIPEKIEGLVASAEETYIELEWAQPAEQDLRYVLVLMRSDNSDVFDSIAFAEPHNNTIKIYNIDDEIVYFKLQSIDIQGNHSLESKTVSAALATFNKGLLVVVDATANPFGFSADSIRNFFGALNSTLPTTIINAKKDMPNIFKSYNIVLWHSTVAALSQVMAVNLEPLEKYVEAGGSLVISTDYPQQLLDISNSKIGSYSMDNPVRKFMGISETSYVNNSRMQTAQGVFAPDLMVDPAKVSVNFEGNLKDFCALEADAPFVSLYNSFTSQSANLMNGNSVGFISYDAPKMCLLAFPLFFFEYSSVVSFMQFLYEEGFYTSSPSLEVVTQNWEIYPNPFSDILLFDFVPQERDLSIVIYNMQGLEVFSKSFAKLPVLEKQHFEFNLSNLAKGAYILKVGDRKEIIIKN